MRNEELSILKNTIEQMASDADDKGLTDFLLRLSVADAFTICKLEPPSRWIPVSERLPAIGEEVLVYSRNSGMAVDYYDRELFGFADVTHWMPLPEPPEEVLP